MFMVIIGVKEWLVIFEIKMIGTTIVRFMQSPNCLIRQMKFRFLGKKFFIFPHMYLKCIKDRKC